MVWITGPMQGTATNTVFHTLQPFTLLSKDVALETQLKLIAQMCMIPLNNIENAYPCTPMQESLAGSHGGNEYLRQLVWTLNNETPLERFQKAWEDTFRANPILRTRIVHLGGQVGYVQAVIAETPVWMQRTTHLGRFLDEDKNIPMTLGGRFIRCAIVAEKFRRYFVLTVHHALFDGASAMELIDECGKRFCNETVEQRYPFENFIKTLVLDADSQEQEHFWKSYLSRNNAAPYPRIPQDPGFHADPATSIIRQLNIQNDLTTLGVNSTILLQAAWAILLFHYTGNDEVVFGSIANGRRAASVPGFSQTTGPTIALYPIRLHIDVKEDVTELLARIRQQVIDLKKFEQTGMSKIRKALAKDGRAPAADFHSLFVIHPVDFNFAGVSAMNKIGITYNDILGKKERQPYPLVITLTLNTRTAATLQLEYDERVVANPQAEDLVHHYQMIVSELGSSKKGSLLGSISPLDKHDMDRIRRLNAVTPPPEAICLHHLFQEQVRRRPYAEAVCSTKTSLTYTDVDKLSSRLALKLVEFGVRPEVFVAVCFEKSIFTVVAILAVMKAGGVYVPIDPAHPQGRIVEIIHTVPIRVAITSPASASVLQGLCEQILIPGNASVADILLPPDCLPGIVRPDNNAYLLFTSGSTGKPKGMLISHSAICTSVLHHGPAFGASPLWRTLQFGSHTFDMSIGEFFTTLSFGGCVCVPSEDERMNDLPGAITGLNANTLLVVPTVATLFTPSQVPTLKTLVLGGEPLTKDMIKRWASHVKLINSYGPSETSVWCSANLNVTADSNPANIGRAIGATMWIVDPNDHHKLTPFGCVGEIVISGALLANGYFNDKAATDAVFVSTPDWFKRLDPESSYRTLYKSGDLGRYNPDGSFQILGRKDTQVKLRGFRIELGEIENRIMDHAMTKAAFATLPTRGPCARQIVALVSFRNPQLGKITANVISVSEQTDNDIRKLKALKTHIRLSLPAYMVPSLWVVVDHIPLLISGKVDRRNLAEWVSSMNQGTFEKVTKFLHIHELAEIIPGSTADTLRKIWSSVLGVAHNLIGLESSFLSLGGDSFYAMQVVSEAKQRGLSLTVSKLLGTRTLGDLAKDVEQSAQGDSLPANQLSSTIRRDIPKAYEQLLRSRLAERPSVKPDEAYPLSPMQHEIMAQRAVNSTIFVFSWVMEFTSKSTEQISINKVVQAWKRVIRKRSILRTIFLQDSTQTLAPLQVVLIDAEPDIAISSSLIEDLNEILPPLDDCFLPYRTHFYWHGDKVVMRVELDHRLIDGWSLRLVKQDLLAAYDANELEMNTENVAYKTFINTHHPSQVDASKRHWASVLHGQQPSLLKLVPKQRLRGTISEKVVLRLPAVDGNSLSAFSAQNGITPASIFDAAWAQTLSVYTRSTDINFEYVNSGRDQDIPGIFEIVGPTINMLAYHLHDVPSDPNPSIFAHLAKVIQEQRLQDGLFTACNIRDVLQNDLRSPKLFNTAVNFQRRPSAVESNSLKIEDDLLNTKDPWHFEILVRILHLVDSNTMWASLEFENLLFDEYQMRDVLDTFWSRIQLAIMQPFAKL